MSEIYNMKTTYLHGKLDDPKDLLQVEIGDSKQPDFKPQTKFMRWNNEVNLSVRLVTDVAQIPVKDGDLIATDNIKFYPIGCCEEHPEGGYEFEVILKEKPKDNIVKFTLNDKGVVYYYQGELTEEEIKEGAFRPDNVIGSYAVYASENKINREGGTKYKCGKVGHIYRPKIEDSAGAWVWGELHIEAGILSVTIPQTFLDTAVYPVRHAAGLTFGYTTAGGTTASIYSNYMYGDGYTAPESGTATNIIAYGRYASVAASIKGVIFTSSTKAILTNGIGGAVALGSTAAWKTSTFSTPPAFTNVEYYICYVANAEAPINYDATAGKYIMEYNTNNYISPENPDAGAYYATGAQISVYCTYEQASSAVNGSVTQVTKALSITSGTQSVAGLVKADGAVTQVTKALSITPGTQAVAGKINGAVSQTTKALNISAGTQVVVGVRIANITQVTKALTISTGTQAVGAVRNANIQQVTKALTVTGGAQEVASVRNANIQQITKELHVTGIAQSIGNEISANVIQVTKSLAIICGNQAVSGQVNASITQITKALSVAHGTQSINGKVNASVTQISKTLHVSTGTQIVASVRNVNIIQVTKALHVSANSSSGDAIRNGSVIQISRSLVVFGGVQSVNGMRNVNIMQVSKQLSVTTGIQAVVGYNQNYKPFIKKVRII